MNATATAEPGVSIDLDSVLKLDAQPPAPITDAVSKALDAQAPAIADQGPMAMNCFSMLDPKTQAAAKAKAKELFPTLYADDNALAIFGNEAVEVINNLVHGMVDDLDKAANIPELTQLTNELDDHLQGFTKKWGNDNDVKGARESYEGLKDKVLDFFGKYRNMLHMLLKDAKGIGAYLDGLKADLIEKQAGLRLNVARCNEIYAANEDAIRRLVVYIAMMECIHEEAEAAVQAIVIDETQPDVREKREERDKLIQWIGMLEVRTGEFKQRLFVAWATSPQIRNIRSISWGLAQRLGLLVNLTIPVFELTVVQWAMALQADQAAKTTEAVQSTTQHAMEAWAKASGDMIPAAAKVIQAPSMDPSAMVAIAESLQKQAEGFVIAYQEGRTKRAAMETAMMNAAKVIATSQDKAAKAVLELVTNAQAVDNTADLPAAIELPSVVTDNAQTVLGAQLKAA
jgi:uncharacterized protein YaaN involved in tellurite resistance